MGLLIRKSEDHVQYNGDETTLLDIKRRHIKENQTIYSGSYAIKNKPVQTPITSTVPLWQSQPARSEVERLIYVKNDILRQMMDWVGGDWVGSVDYGKNTIITYDAPEELKQKTDWNDNFDQALADNFGMQFCIGDIGISIQMINCICETELSLKSIASDGSELRPSDLKDALYGKASTGDASDTDTKTYGYGLKYWYSDTEYYSDAPGGGGISMENLLAKLGKDHWNSLEELRPYFLARLKGLRKKVCTWLGSENFSQNVIDALVHRAYCSEGPAAEMAKKLRNGESVQSVYNNWNHLGYCKAKNGGGTGSYRGWADGFTRNCEEMRDWFLNGPNEHFRDKTEGSDIIGGSSSGSSGSSGGSAGGVAAPVSTPPNLAKHGFSLQRAINAMRQVNLSLSKHLCGRYSQKWIDAGFNRTGSHPGSAILWHTDGFLKRLGYTLVCELGKAAVDNPAMKDTGRDANSFSSQAQEGDVAVMVDLSDHANPSYSYSYYNRRKGRTETRNAHGHICVRLEGQWVSDYKQGQRMNPYGNTHTFIYRLV